MSVETGTILYKKQLKKRRQIGINHIAHSDSVWSGRLALGDR